jgi:hypothetical protein
MTLQGKGEGGDSGQDEGHQLLNVALMQGRELPDDCAYLDGCSTVMAFKSKKYRKNGKTVTRGIKINCNAGSVTTNQKGNYGRLQVWYLPKGIANIFSMHKLKKMYRITYDSRDEYYAVHMPRGQVWFYKDKQGLPYMDLKKSSQEAAMMLLQGHTAVEQTEGTSLIQIVQGNYEGFTKKEILQVEEVR